MRSISPACGRSSEDIVFELADRASTGGRRPLILGLCGAQGSGKSTLTRGLAERFRASGRTVAHLSLDDLYLTRAERLTLARDVHALLATRGVPGTHDVALGLRLFRDIDSGLPVMLPRFDKAVDDRAPAKAWECVAGPIDVLIFEGWCVGARPQSEAALEPPINDLERRDDPSAVWRHFVNERLSREYQQLFERIDIQVLLAAPDFGVVEQWRKEQERELRARVGQLAPGLLSDVQLREFIQHYERLTRHILREMPHRADLVIDLDPDRAPIGMWYAVPVRR
jgi:D-glycerate 3-kinase